MSDRRIRVILADDHAIVLHGLQRLFSQQGEFDVVACCGGGAEAVATLRQHGADVMVLDLRMPGWSGMDVLRAVKREGLPCRTVLLTAVVTHDEVLEALDLGLGGLVLKESTPEALLDCVRRVHRGQQSIDEPSLAGAMDQSRRRSVGAATGAKPLTPRELEIVQLVAQGHRNRSIANQLSISEGTVKIHLHNVYEKLGIDGRLELLLWAREQGVA